MKFILCLVGLVAVSAINLDQMPEDAVELKVGDYYDEDGLESGNINDVEEDSDHDSEAEEAGEMIKIVIAMDKQMDDAGVSKWTKAQLTAAGRKYLADNHMTDVSDKDFNQTINEIWTHVNTNGDKYISSEELGKALYGIVDQNGDGTLEINELEDLVKVLAGAFNVTLKAGWEAKVKGWFDDVNTDGSKGIEMKELTAWLDKTDNRLHGLKGAIESLG